MTRNPEKTQENILKSAKTEFLQYGFSHASMRAIAKGAKVTTGAMYTHFADKNALFEALVAPCFYEFMDFFQTSSDQYISDFDMNNMLAGSRSNLVRMIDYVYDHFDIFKLLISASEQTAFENFTHMLIDEEINMTLRFMNEIRSKGFEVTTLSREEIHILVSAQLSTLFEMILHDVPKEKALQHIIIIGRFSPQVGRNYLRYANNNPA